MTTERQLSRGEQLVRVQFNPSDEGIVYDIKRHSAALIDLIDKIPSVSGDAARHKALAITAFEEGAMWGVKAATSEPTKG